MSTIDLHQIYYGEEDQYIDNMLFDSFTGELLETVTQTMNFDMGLTQSIIIGVDRDTFIDGNGVSNIRINGDSSIIKSITMSMGGTTMDVNLPQYSGSTDIIRDFIADKVLPFTPYTNLTINVTVDLNTQLDLVYDVVKINNYNSYSNTLLTENTQYSNEFITTLNDNVVNASFNHLVTEITIVTDFNFGIDAIMKLDENEIPVSLFVKSGNKYTYTFDKSVNFGNVGSTTLIFTCDGEYKLCIIAKHTKAMCIQMGMSAILFTN